MAISQNAKNVLQVAMADQGAANELVTILNKGAGITAGTTPASGFIQVDANKHTDVLGLPTGGLKIGASGSETVVTATGADMNAQHLQPSTVTIAAAAGGANVSLVTFTVKDPDGTAVTGPVVMDVLLSDASTGAGLTSTTASGAVAAGASGTDLATLVSKKALRVQTNASGVYILSITDSVKTGFYPVAQLPGRKAIVGTQLVTGSYG